MTSLSTMQKMQPSTSCSNSEQEEVQATMNRLPVVPHLGIHMGKFGQSDIIDFVLKGLEAKLKPSASCMEEMSNFTDHLMKTIMGMVKRNELLLIKNNVVTCNKVGASEWNTVHRNKISTDVLVKFKFIDEFVNTSRKEKWNYVIMILGHVLKQWSTRVYADYIVVRPASNNFKVILVPYFADIVGKTIPNRYLYAKSQFYWVISYLDENYLKCSVVRIFKHLAYVYPELAIISPWAIICLAHVAYIDKSNIKKNLDSTMAVFLTKMAHKELLPNCSEAFLNYPSTGDNSILPQQYQQIKDRARFLLKAFEYECSLQSIMSPLELTSEEIFAKRRLIETAINALPNK